MIILFGAAIIPLRPCNHTCAIFEISFAEILINSSGEGSRFPNSIVNAGSWARKARWIATIISALTCLEEMPCRRATVSIAFAVSIHNPPDVTDFIEGYAKTRRPARKRAYYMLFCIKNQVLKALCDFCRTIFVAKNLIPLYIGSVL